MRRTGAGGTKSGAAARCDAGGAALVGADLCKSRPVLELSPKHFVVENCLVHFDVPSRLH